MCCADKFGNIFILWLPATFEEDSEADFSNYKLYWENSYLNGASVKFEQICSFYDINLVTSI